MSFGGASGSDLLDGRLPVFVFPTQLLFYSDDPQSHTRVLTVYNPYDFPLSYKVFSTDPVKYSVTDPEGVIKSRCGVDVLVRHVDVGVRHEGVKEKFRVQVSEYKKKKILGRRDVGAILLPTQDASKSDVEKPFAEFFGPSSSVPSPSSPSRPPSIGQPSTQDQNRLQPQGPISSPWAVGVVAMVCLLGLMLPSVGEMPPTFVEWPDYLFLTLHQKLLAAYVLGMITVIVFRR